MNKYARKSFGEPYLCKQDWAEDCFVQCGGDGIVFSQGGFQEIMFSDNPIESLAKESAKPTTYRTAFFEAFPRNPDTFIRGEGKTIEEAEEKAWNKLQKYLACTGHEFEKRGYTNGAGFCKHCNMFASKVFEPEPPTEDEKKQIAKWEAMLEKDRRTMERMIQKSKEKKMREESNES